MRYVAGGLLLMTMACASVPPDGDVPEAGNGSYICNAEGLGDLIGRPATRDLGAEALRRSGAATLRWIRPGEAVTMDYRPDRLNIHLDAGNRAERFRCG